MKKYFLRVGAGFIVVMLGVVTFGCSRAVPLGNEVFESSIDSVTSPMKAAKITVHGTVLDVALSANVITIKNSVGDKLSIALVPETKIFNVRHEAVALKYVLPTFVIEAVGKSGTADAIIAERIDITLEPNIVVFTPTKNQNVTSPLILTGVAREFENTFNYQLKDENGDVLSEHFSTATGSDAGQYGSFRVEMPFSTPHGTYGTLNVFAYSPLDGSIIDRVSIPVTFGNPQTMSFDVYFPNRGLDNLLDCSAVYALARTAPLVPAIGRAALIEMLKGPTVAEKRQGYFSNINDKVTVNKLVIERGTATVDFSSELYFQVGGACRIAGIYAQINETLKQFSSVQNVVITIDGHPAADSLQP